MADDISVGTETTLRDNSGKEIGKVLVNENGTYTVTPAENYTGKLPVISYTVSDGKGGTDEGTLTVTNGNTNTAPVAVDDAATGSTTKPAKGNVLTNDSDVNGDPLIVTGVKVDTDGDGQADDIPVGTETTLRDNAGKEIGKVLVNKGGTYTVTPAENYTGELPQITYTVSDGKGGEASSTLTVTNGNTNTAPVAVDDAATGSTTKPAKGNVLTNDSDVNGDPLIVTGVKVDTDGNGVADDISVGTETTLRDNSGKEIGKVLVNENGTYTVTPAENYTGKLPVISYTVSDGKGGTDEGTLTVTNGNTNTAPVAVDDAATGSTTKPAKGNVLTNDSDVNGDPLIVTGVKVDTDGDGQADDIPVGTETTLRDNAGKEIGKVLVNKGGTYTVTPAENYTGELPQITYTVSDGKGGEASSTLTVTNGNTNTAPVAVDDAATGSTTKPAKVMC
ncbi:cadherin-like domain-containing protein [Avibacterium sp. 21-595]|uniref:Ig-like domain-containing protein n=1 Tax=Avibacterium sp. 21-595 TaxID=2911527 RepID=UPI0020268BE1|nr:tandem-95 repeat protein [Avibacterium sp. 21-595]URL06559.1 cadherin-like domain-containing protein [Avibacterium sp. 21-595]